MRDSTLPSPNIGGTGHHLRRVSAKAISQIEITASKYTGGKPAQAATLKAFFDAASAALAAYV